MSATYSISDIAQLLDVTPRTLRFYEEQGMVTPTRRGQERIYAPRDLVAMKLILRGNRKQLDRFLEKITERRVQLQQQMLDIEQMQVELDTAEERCRAALQT